MNSSNRILAKEYSGDEAIEGIKDLGDLNGLDGLDGLEELGDEQELSELPEPDSPDGELPVTNADFARSRVGANNPPPSSTTRKAGYGLTKSGGVPVQVSEVATPVSSVSELTSPSPKATRPVAPIPPPPDTRPKKIEYWDDYLMRVMISGITANTCHQWASALQNPNFNVTAPLNEWYPLQHLFAKGIGDTLKIDDSAHTFLSSVVEGPFIARYKEKYESLPEEQKNLCSWEEIERRLLAEYNGEKHFALSRVTNLLDHGELYYINKGGNPVFRDIVRNPGDADSARYVEVLPAGKGVIESSKDSPEASESLLEDIVEETREELLKVAFQYMQHIRDGKEIKVIPIKSPVNQVRKALYDQGARKERRLKFFPDKRLILSDPELNFLTNYAEQWENLTGKEKKLCSRTEFIRRLCANNYYYLKLAIDLREHGLLIGIDNEGNPVMTDKGVEPVWKGRNYPDAREAVLSEGYRMLAPLGDTGMSEILLKLAKKRGILISSTDGQEPRGAYLDRGENPEVASVAVYRPETKKCTISTCDPYNMDKKLGTIRVLVIEDLKPPMVHSDGPIEYLPA